jgi:tripartite-type tricarboxylate transporter receptor subunit TctC
MGTVFRKAIVLFAAVMFTAGLIFAAGATAQDKYPSRAIEYIVPWGPGGGADQLARKSAVLLEKILNVPLPVINVPGATGGTGITKMLAAPADGQSIAIYIADSHAVLATGEATWKMSDIVPVARMILAPSFLFVAADSRFKSWADFEKEAKANPGKLKVATLGFGSVDDITLTYLEGKGVKVVQVPYSKPSERYVSVLGGHVDALYEQAGDVQQYLTGKQIRPIIMFGPQRFEFFKDVP